MTSQEKRHNDFEAWKLDLEARLAWYLFSEPEFNLKQLPAAPTDTKTPTQTA